MLNETPVRGEGFEATGPVSGGKPEATMLQPNPTELDHFERRLERWCKDAEQRVKEQRKGQANNSGQIPDMTQEQKRYYLLHSGDYHGVEYRKAAASLGMNEQSVYDLRKRLGLNPRNGQRRAA
jgi:DNA-binding NtrC family response regulator